MTRTLAIEHGCTSILGLVILGLIAWGTLRFGFAEMFTIKLGRLVVGLALLDAVGVAMWS